MGYTHLMYNAGESWLSKVSDDERGGIFSPDFEQLCLQLEFADRGIRLYRIRDLLGLPGVYKLETGKNLLKNPNFQALDADNKPLYWNVSRAPCEFGSSGTRVIRVQEGDRMTQSVAVRDHHIYELELDVQTEAAEQIAYVLINWLDNTGRIRLSWCEAISHVGSSARYRFLQTAPSGVEQAMISLGGEGNIDTVSFRSFVHRLTKVSKASFEQKNDRDATR